MGEKNDDRFGNNGSHALCRERICGGPNQEPVKGPNKKYLSDRNPRPDSQPGSAKEPHQGSHSDQGSRKGWFQ